MDIEIKSKWETQSGGGVHVYDENGDEILTYTASVGWHEKESKAETEVHGAVLVNTEGLDK